MELFVVMLLDLRNHILIETNSGYSYENKIHQPWIQPLDPCNCGLWVELHNMAKWINGKDLAGEKI